MQLAALGKDAVEIDGILSQFQVYISKLKVGHFATELNSIGDRETFMEKLHEIFEVTWANYIPDHYRDLPEHFYDYLKYLDSAQAIWGEYFNDDEKSKYDLDDYPDMPIAELTEYETRFLNSEGKLTCLRNPILLCTIRKAMNNGVIDLAKSARTCKLFYGSLLPNMKISDFKELLGNIWERTNVVRRGNGTHKIALIYPDGTEATNNIQDTLAKVVLFYGPEAVYDKKVKLRNTDVVVRNIPLGREKTYKVLCEGWYIIAIGDFKTMLNTMRCINMILGERLKIAVVN